MKISERIKNDYFAGNKYREYENILAKALNSGYSFASLRDFSVDNTFTVYLRHDIDSDIAIAKKMFEIEKKLNIRSTYYFRLGTLNKSFIEELKKYGCEVSYHFEEISSYAYKHNLNTAKKIRPHFAEISEEFIKNLNTVRKKTACECVTIASHGDFVNRKTNVINNEFLTQGLREKCGILYEAYDEILMQNCKYVSDGKPEFSKEADFSEGKNYYLLVHPRSWCSNFAGRFCMDAKRAFKGIKYKLGCSLQEITEILKSIKALPKEQIVITGECNKAIYKYFSKRHPKYKIIGNKTLGACLLAKPESFESFLTGKAKQTLRTRRNKCSKLDYSFKKINASEHIDEILEINSSKCERQGRSMDSDYFDADSIIENAKDKECFGVFDKTGKLASYCYLIDGGDIVIISRLLGHADYLNDGVMHFMISECVRLWLNGRWKAARYFFYDTWFGASSGIKTFKSDLGFLPYRVKYKFKKEV